MPEFVGIVLTKKLPATAVVDTTYKTEGSVKLFDAVGAPPWVYARVKKKEWYKPEFAEEATYNRGWPVPLSGAFTIEFKPEKEGEYEVTIVATPAPFPLPAIGVPPILAESDVMKVTVGQKPPAVFRFAGITIDGTKVPLGNHDADPKLLIQKKTTDSLEIIPSYEWVGPKKSATISVKAGYRDWAGGFTPKTDAYTAAIELPESPAKPFSGVAKAITVPLTACGDISDGAIEIVAKLPDMGDYITRIWNVYQTKAAVVSFRFSAIIIDGQTVALTNHDADSGLRLVKTTADSLSVTPAFEWQGSKRSATISIKAGYRDWAGGFTPKTDAYTATFELPESIDKKYSGELTKPISVPLIACAGLDDGAIEVVLKITGAPDYISHIWNVYTTKAGIIFKTLEVNIDPAGAGYVTTDPAPSGGTQHNWQFPQGITVYVTAHPSSGYRFKSWSGEMTDTTAITAPVYPMTEKRTITAHFEKEITVPPKADIRNIDFVATGGTYKIGDRVPFSLSYEYRGRGQSGQLLLSLGTGVAPSFFTVVEYSPMAVTFDEAMDWTPGSLSGTFLLTPDLELGQRYNTRAKLETLEDITAETDTDWGVITIATVPVGVSFEVGIWGIPGFGSYQKWCCYYWNPGTGSFTGDGKWYNSSDRIVFSNVEPGGYLAVFLMRDSMVSGQYSSPPFQPVSGGFYTYDVEMGVIYG